MKTILVHMYSHYPYFEYCPIKYCLSSRLIYWHFLICKSANCLACKPFSKILETSGFEKQCCPDIQINQDQGGRDSMTRSIRDAIVSFFVENASFEWDWKYAQHVEKYLFKSTFSKEEYLKKLAGTMCEPPPMEDNIEPIKQQDFSDYNVYLPGYPAGFFNGINTYNALTDYIYELMDKNDNS